MKILIVEDDSMIANLYKHIIKKRGHLADVTENPEEVISLIHENHYDGVVSDFSMANKNGVELCREVKAIFPNVFFAVCTGDLNFLEECGPCPADAKLQKPFNMKELIDKMNCVMSS